jgi:hypothetical protein
MVVLTDPIPSVQELPKTGIAYLDRPINEIMESVRGWNWELELQKAQDYIEENYSPEVITSKWVQVFRSLV